MCILCSSQISSSDEYINCSCCKNVDSIPVEATWITSLLIQDCPKITFLPFGFRNLKKLNCSFNPLLKSIPHDMISLVLLQCSSCPLLTSIPEDLSFLVYLDCMNCPLLQRVSKKMLALKCLQIEGCLLLHDISRNMPALENVIGHNQRNILCLPIKVIDKAKSYNNSSLRNGVNFRFVIALKNLIYFYTVDVNIRLEIRCNDALFRPGGVMYIELVKKYKDGFVQSS